MQESNWSNPYTEYAFEQVLIDNLKNESLKSFAQYIH